MKLLQERTGKTLEHVSIGNNLQIRTQVAQQLGKSFNK
jgi:hypothetical protein